MDLASLRYPRKSHRKVIKLPKDSTTLAEFMGIEFGDGGINNPWQIVITLNSEKDKEYAQHVTQIIFNLFGVTPAVRKRKTRNALQIISSSTSLVDFVVTKGAARGNKILQNFDIPKWIYKKAVYQKAFVRGLMDTDGCLYIHRHKVGGKLYKNLGLCFSSSSSNLLHSVAGILDKFDIQPHIPATGKNIYLYSSGAVLRYLRIFGSSNPRITAKYEEWRGAGVV